MLCLLSELLCIYLFSLFIQHLFSFFLPQFCSYIMLCDKQKCRLLVGPVIGCIALNFVLLSPLRMTASDTRLITLPEEEELINPVSAQCVSIAASVVHDSPARDPANSSMGSIVSTATGTEIYYPRGSTLTLRNAKTRTSVRSKLKSYLSRPFTRYLLKSCNVAFIMRVVLGLLFFKCGPFWLTQGARSWQVMRSKVSAKMLRHVKIFSS